MTQNRTEYKNVFTGIITSKMRIQILMRLFLNPKNRAYLREMATEFDASPGQLREELGQLAGADIVKFERVGRQVYYHANEKHPLFPELNSMVRKALGMDRILESIVERLGNLQRAALIDDYAEGKDTGIIDLVLLGNIDQSNLPELVMKAERYLGRRVRTLTFEPREAKQFNSLLRERPSLLLWDRDLVT